MIGIFGGTFDPVHYGHLRSALEVKDHFGLNQIHLIPCGQPPHRNKPLASAHTRMQLLQLAIAGQSGFIADDRELNRAGRSYMIDTLRSLRLEFAEDSLLLIIGMDAFNNLTQWHQWQQLFDVAHIVVMTRPGHQVTDLDAFFQTRLSVNKADLSRQSNGHLYFLPVTSLDISASAIRALFARGQNPRFLLPDSVIDYIKQQGLYRAG